MEIPIDPIPSELKPKDKRIAKLNKALPKIPSNFLIAGRVGTGKSSCLYSLLTKKQGYIVNGKSIFDEMIIFVGNGESDWAFEKIPCKNMIILHEFSNDALDNYLEDLRKHQLERLEKNKPPLNACIIFDDMATQDLIKKRNGKSPLVSLILTSRHELNCTTFFLTQVVKSTGFQVPAVRNNITTWIVYDMSKPEAEKIFDDHCNNFEPKDLEAQYEKMMAKPHNFMVIDYRRPLDQRITERFTKVIHPKGAVPIEIKHESESDEPAI